jgi:UDP-2,3-diacylglucosamine pyrophosphatase LpxH
VINRISRQKLKTLFISDLHLGARGCQAESFLAFLQHYEAETIFLAGDIIDGWRLKAAWHWPPSHNVVLQKLRRRARKGTQIVYIPGNHDEFLRRYDGESFGNIEIREEATHELLDGRKVLVLHGDKFDTAVRNIKILALLGDWGYDLAIYINRYLNIARRMMGLPYWSFSAAVKLKVKRAVNFINAFEGAVASDARSQGAQVVICGHIHHAAERRIGDILYMNCGDWVESRTAIAEHFDGRLELLCWNEAMNAKKFVAIPDRRRLEAIS